MPLIQTENLTKVYGKGEAAGVPCARPCECDREPWRMRRGDGSQRLWQIHPAAPPRRAGSPYGRPGDDRRQFSLQVVGRCGHQDSTTQIGFVFQFFNLIPILSSVDNAVLPLLLDGKNGAGARQKATEWLQKVGLGARLSNRPDQLSAGHSSAWPLLAC